MYSRIGDLTVLHLSTIYVLHLQASHPGIRVDKLLLHRAALDDGAEAIVVGDVGVREAQRGPKQRP